MRIAAAIAAVALVQASPVVVTGHGYAPHAHVIVVYRSGSTRSTRSVIATAAGTFRVTFGTASFKRCDGFSLTAGAAGLHVASCAAGGRPHIAGDRSGAVDGNAFVPGERVSVVAHETGTPSVSSTVTTGASGRFEVRLALTQVPCRRIDYVATGSLGSRAAFLTPTPDCAAP